MWPYVACLVGRGKYQKGESGVPGTILSSSSLYVQIVHRRRKVDLENSLRWIFARCGRPRRQSRDVFPLLRECRALRRVRFDADVPSLIVYR